MTPRKQRRTSFRRDPSPTAANYKRWRADRVVKAESTRWTAIHHMPLKPKHISLVWQLQHMSPDNTDKCPSCGNLAPDRSTPPPSPEHREDLAHYFHCCARVRRFWPLVGRFLAHTLLRTHRHTSLAITPREVAHGFGAWSALRPDHAALHGLALWEIFRAHTEALFDTAAVKTGDAMFVRWKHAVMQRVVHGFYTHAPNNSSRIFKARWTDMESACFIPWPSRSVLLEMCTLSFTHPSFDPDHPGSLSLLEFTTAVRPGPAPISALSTADAPLSTR